MLGGCIALSLAPSYLAAQGLPPDTQAQLTAISRYLEEPPSGSRPVQVDLRYWLPPIGEQTMNDCAAWAFGYYAKTYLEARDQGWRPVTTAQIFSPTYLYNQINGGKDEGSDPETLFLLLENRGAATLSQAPYLRGDFRTQPTEQAHGEAAAFRNAATFMLRHGDDIRSALARGYIVSVGVRTNPVFNAARYGLYTPDLHREGERLRRPDQPHGYHAMTIAGYDDRARAFLFVNSWGAKWGQQGCVWVSYDVADRFGDAFGSQPFVILAAVMVDLPQTVAYDQAARRFRGVEETDLRPSARGDYRGWDAATGTPLFAYEIFLSRPVALQIPLVSVRVTARTANGEVALPEQVFDPSSPPALVRFHFNLPEPRAAFTLVATFRDGTERHLTASATSARMAPVRSARLERIDTFAGYDDQRRPVWRQTYQVLFDADSGANLQGTDWQLTPAGQARHAAFPGYHASELFSDVAGGQFRAYHADAPLDSEITAVLRYYDGQQITLRPEPRPLPPVPYQPPLNYGDIRAEMFTLTPGWRYDGGTGAGAHYTFDLRLHYPTHLSERIRQVVFEVGVYRNAQRLIGRAETAQGLPLYTAEGYLTRPSPVRALVTVDLGQGRTQTIVVGGPDLDLDARVAYADPRQIGIDYTERYAGRKDGRPAWEVDFFVTGTGAQQTIAGVTYGFPEGDRSVFAFATNDLSFPAGTTLHAAQTIPVEVTFVDGTSATWQVPWAPQRAPNDAIHVAVGRGLLRPLASRASPSRTDAVLLPPSTDWRTFAIVGETERVRQLTAATLYYRDRHGLSSSLRLRAGPQRFPDGLHGRFAQDARHEEVWTRLDFEGGIVQWLRTVPSGLAPEPTPPRLQLEAREAYHDTTPAALPRWRAELSLRGDLDHRGSLTAPVWSAIAPDGSAVPLELAADRRSAAVVTSVPLRIRVAFDAKSGPASPPPLEALVTTTAPRAPEQLGLQILPGLGLNEMADPHVRSVATAAAADLSQGMADSYSSEDATGEQDDETLGTPLLFRLQGTARLLAGVAKVDYEVTVPYLQETYNLPALVGGSAASRFAYFRDGFPVLIPVRGPATVNAVLHLANGRTRTLGPVSFSEAEVLDQHRPDLAPARRPPQIRLRPWTPLDGQPAQLLELALDLDGSDFPGGEFSAYSFLPAAAVRPFPPESSDAGYDRPGHRQVFLQTAPAALVRSQLTGDFEGQTEFRAEGFSHAAIPLPFTPAPAGLQVEVRPDPGKAPQLHHLCLTGPEPLLGAIQSVTYLVTVGGQTTRWSPPLRWGELGDGWDIKWPGPMPDQVAVEIEADAGSALVAALWRRQP